MSKFKKGDRAIMVGDGCASVEPGEMVTIVESRASGSWVSFDGDKGNQCGDTIASTSVGGSHELRLVTSNSKENKPMGRRTFKLVKAMPGVKVGTLFQEECEDGTQPYSPMDTVSGAKLQFSDRSLVEESPFFVEVFKVEPEYMTREQLDAFEAFKKSLKPAAKKRGQPAKTNKLPDSTRASMKASWTPERRKAQARRMRKLHKQRKQEAK